MSEKGFPEVRLKVSVRSEFVRAGRKLGMLLGRASDCMEIERPDRTQYIMRWQEILDDCISEYRRGRGAVDRLQLWAGTMHCYLLCSYPFPRDWKCLRHR